MPGTPWALSDLQATQANGWLRSARETVDGFLRDSLAPAVQRVVETRAAEQEKQDIAAFELPSFESLALWRKDEPQQQPQPTPSGTPSAMPGQRRTVEATIQDGRVTPPTSGGQWTEMPVQRPMNADTPPATGDIDNSSRASFVRTAWPYVLRAANGDQNLAELMLAKAISENGDIGKGGEIIGWNVSGIKGTGDAGSFEADTWEDYGNGRVDIRDRFAAYSGPEAGFGAFMKFLQDNPRYHRALAEYQQTGNAEKLFDDVNAAGYATDPIWSQKLRSIRDSQVAPIVRGQTADPRQSSMNAVGAASSSLPPAAGPAAGPPAGGGAGSLPPSVVANWRQMYGRDPDPQEQQELMTEMARFMA